MVASGKSSRLPSKQQMQVWREFIEATELLTSRLANRLQSESSLSTGDYQVLLVLTEAEGQRLRSSELAALIGWERSRLSHHLGRMEKRGLIRREECAEDSRGAEVVLADPGAQAFRSSSVPHLRAVRELFIDAFTADQLAQMKTLTGSLRAHLDGSRPSAGPGVSE